MPRDWIKMRTDLPNDPKVIAIAQYLSCTREYMDWLTNPVQQTCAESSDEHVTLSVTICVTVTGLLRTWGVVREQGRRQNDDIIVDCLSLKGIDFISGIPGFGDALQAVGWAGELDSNLVVFPNFFKINDSTEELRKKRDAERKRKQRAKSSGQSMDTSMDTSTDTSEDKSGKCPPEKRREEENILGTHTAREFGESPVSLEAAKSYAPQAGVTPECAEMWWYDCDSRNWLDKSAQPISHWQSHLKKFSLSYEEIRARQNSKPKSSNPNPPAKGDIHNWLKS